MAFTPVSVPAPQSIADISVTLVDYLDVEEVDTVLYEVQIVYDDGRTRLTNGVLTSHLTAAQITWLQTFMADMRVLAQGLIS
jgi:hypothetical protein